MKYSPAAISDAVYDALSNESTDEKDHRRFGALVAVSGESVNDPQIEVVFINKGRSLEIDGTGVIRPGAVFVPADAVWDKEGDYIQPHDGGTAAAIVSAAYGDSKLDV